jgi:hypothetical protein
LVETCAMPKLEEGAAVKAEAAAPARTRATTERRIRVFTVVLL